MEGYKGVHFPQWMSSPSLKYLTILKLLNCKNSLRLPTLGKLPSLKTLTLDMNHVEYLYEESYDGGVVFRDLEVQTIHHIPKFKRLSREYGENMFPHLSMIGIVDCPKFLREEVLLKGLDSFFVFNCSRFNVSTDFQRLWKLWISNCREEEDLLALQDMTSLKVLRLKNISKVRIIA